MKKQYIVPVTETVVLSHSTMICGSLGGVEGTSNFSEGITSDTTEDVLSRGGFWDDED